MKNKLKFYLGMLVCFFSFASLAQNAKNPYGFKTEYFPFKLVRIAGGQEGGATYPIAEKICDLINDFRLASDLRCVLMETSGAEFNVSGLEKELFELSFIQTNNLPFDKIADNAGGSSLRLLSNLGNIPLNVYAKNQIKTIKDLGGSKYNANNTGSGSAAGSKVFLEAAQLREKDFSAVERLKASEINSSFCDDKFTSGIFMAAHPNPILKKVLDCNGHFISMTDEILSNFTKLIPSAKPFVIQKSTYPELTDEIKTVAIPLVLVTHSGVDNEAISRLMKILNSNFDKVHDAFKYLNPKATPINELQEINFPIHDGLR